MDKLTLTAATLATQNTRVPLAHGLIRQIQTGQAAMEVQLFVQFGDGKIKTLKKPALHHTPVQAVATFLTMHAVEQMLRKVLYAIIHNFATHQATTT